MLTLSTAIVYWMRSLVPIEKKSTCLASSSAMRAAEGTSIIMPISMLGSNGVFDLLSSSMHSLRMSLARRSSLSPDMSGNMTPSFPCALAFRMARSCSLNIPCLASETRIPRQPRNGLGSGSGRGSAGSLSPPASRVRMMAW